MTEQDKNQTEIKENDPRESVRSASSERDGASLNAEPGDDSELGLKIKKVESELSEYKDRYLRAVAEMENMRRRTERERSDLINYALESFMRDVVPIMDGFEKALAGIDEVERSNPVAQGLHMLAKQIVGVLQKHGLKEIQSVGQPFDPNLHQAIQTFDSQETDTERVHQEFAKGYLLHGRLIRPAIVSVAKPSSAEDTH